MLPFLSDDEIDGLCDGYTQNAAKIRFLRGLGLTVEQKPNGRPLVNRAHYDQVCGHRQLETSGAVEGPRWGVH